MGEPGTVRIVGQVRAPSGRSVTAVRFSVDGILLGTVTSGPPYAIEWTDDNPFQRSEIVVEAEDNEGGVGRDRIVLEPFVVTELAEITSVLVEAGVYDKQGRMVRGMHGAGVHPRRRRRAPDAGHGRAGDHSNDVRPARRRQPEHVAEHGLRARGSGQAHRLPAAEGPRAGGPVLAAVAGRHRADQRPADHRRGRRRHQRAGRHGHARLDDRDCGPIRGRRGPQSDRADHGRLRRTQPVVARRCGRGGEGGRRHGVHASVSAAWPGSR